MGERRTQSAAAIMMVRPAAFGFNEETAATNTFQTRLDHVSDDELQEKAVVEFDGLVEGLRRADVDVVVVDDRPEPRTPDAVFPNNWISFHHDGTVILYPMCAPIRRLERRADVIETLQALHGFYVRRVIDLSVREFDAEFLEGTGSVVFDHPNRVAYANTSPRTHPRLLEELARTLDCELVAFRATDAAGVDVYHTNVVMSIGTGFVVVCADAIVGDSDRERVVERLRSSGREMILIDRDQMAHFAGNVLEVENRNGEKVLVMSDEACRAFRPDQIEALGRHARVVSAPLTTIETVEGGSARCMIAGIHLPRRPIFD